MRLCTVGLVVTLVLGVVLLGCSSPPRSRAPASPSRATATEPTSSITELHSSPHVRFGVPVDANPTDDYLIDRGVYVASYNRNRGVANWVAWRLTAEDLGPADRADDFRADERLPPDFYRVLPGDYARSGYDRGHLCPSSHRTHDTGSNSTTFLMTNMIPQAHALNAGPWKGIESYERELVGRKDKDVYVVAGGIFGEAPATIGRGVAVPVTSYRITLVVEHGQDPTDVSVATPVFAVEMPNSAAAKGRKWVEFGVSVDKVEADTGYDFLSALPDEVEDRLEARLPSGP